MHVGLLGLGVGTLVAYGQLGDEYRLYEINPVVVDLAQGQGNYFSFLRDSQANITMVLGDARLSLERELASGKSQDFDVLVLDTFSSDSIPVHLATKEAFAIYLARLAPDGIIAAHITNLHLDLQPVFWQLAQYYDLSIVRVNYPGDSSGGYASHWILLARDPALLQARQRSRPLLRWRRARPRAARGPDPYGRRVARRARRERIGTVQDDGGRTDAGRGARSLGRSRGRILRSRRAPVRHRTAAGQAEAVRPERRGGLGAGPAGADHRRA